VGVAAQVLLDALGRSHALASQEGWVTFLAGAGSVVLTFLAGAELEPEAFRRRWRESTALGLVGFGAPFLGAAWAARFLLGWDPRASWLAGVALSTTSVAVVYAVLLELGLNRTEFGKVILSACFINDLGTVIALGLLFAPFTARTAVFVAALVTGLVTLVWATGPFFRRYGGRTAEFETKFLLLALFLLGGLAAWSGSEAVLPAYVIGMALAGVVGRDHGLLRRFRTLTFGLLTPFYFIRAGSFVQVSTVLAGFAPFLVLFAAKGREQVRRDLPPDPPVPVCPRRGHVHHPLDVHGPHLRDHLVPVRAHPRDHHPIPVLLARGRGHRQRGDPHLGGQPVLPAPPPRGARPGGPGGSRFRR
jgi:glutathione-regulated potassium-efflux system ancillary protein KefC